MISNISRLEQDIVDGHRLLIPHRAWVIPFPLSLPYFPFPFPFPSSLSGGSFHALPVTETAVAGGARPEAGGRRGQAFSLVSLSHAELTRKPYNV